MPATKLSCPTCANTKIHLQAVLIDQGGPVTRIDGSGHRLLRGSEATYIRENLPRNDHGSGVHTVYRCEDCTNNGERDRFYESSVFDRGDILQEAGTLEDYPIHPKELWREEA